MRRRVFLRTAALVLATSLAAFAGEETPETKTETLKGKAVVLDEPPPTQLAEVARPRPLRDALWVGEAVFPAEKVGGATLIATQPGGKPTAAARPGETVTLAWTDPFGAHKMRVGFATLPDGSLGCFNAGAWRFAVAGTTVTLVDGNLDGVYGEAEQDGWIVGESGFVLPFIGRGRFAAIGRSWVLLNIARDGSWLGATIEPIVASAQQFATLDALNLVRLSVGVPPIGLDVAKSRGCTDHARYLAARHWTGDTNPHDEDPTAPESTGSGLIAARGSVIVKDSPVDAVASFWRTWYHRIPIIDPELAPVGIAAAPAGISMIDVSGKYVRSIANWRDPIFAPADGSVGVPTSFWPSGESPHEPVPDAGRRGMPLMALFASRTPGVTGLAVTLVEVRGAKEIPVTTLPVDRRESFEAVGCVPEAPLASHASYRATFTFTRNGTVETHVVRFRTE